MAPPGCPATLYRPLSHIGKGLNQNLSESWQDACDPPRTQRNRVPHPEPFLSPLGGCHETVSHHFCLAPFRVQWQTVKPLRCSLAWALYQWSISLYHCSLSTPLVLVSSLVVCRNKTRQLASSVTLPLTVYVSNKLPKSKSGSLSLCLSNRSGLGLGLPLSSVLDRTERKKKMVKRAAKVQKKSMENYS